MDEKNETLKELRERLDFLSFRQDLMFYDGPVNRVLYEYKVTKEQYDKVVDLMDKYRKDISEEKEVNHNRFESDIYEIVPERKQDYHFVEFLCKSFWEEDRWEEVFEKLYASLPKYENLFKE